VYQRRAAPTKLEMNGNNPNNQTPTIKPGRAGRETEESEIPHRE